MSDKELTEALTFYPTVDVVTFTVNLWTALRFKKVMHMHTTCVFDGILCFKMVQIDASTLQAGSTRENNQKL